MSKLATTLSSPNTNPQSQPWRWKLQQTMMMMKKKKKNKKMKRFHIVLVSWGNETKGFWWDEWHGSPTWTASASWHEESWQGSLEKHCSFSLSLSGVWGFGEAFDNNKCMNLYSTDLFSNTSKFMGIFWNVKRKKRKRLLHFFFGFKAPNLFSSMQMTTYSLQPRECNKRV